MTAHSPGAVTDPWNDVKLASPCPADWSLMKGDHRVRYCGLCRLNVYNLSAMRKEDALNLVRRSEGRVCVRLLRRADGTLLTANCPIGDSFVAAWTRLEKRVERAVWRYPVAVLGLFVFAVLVVSLFGDTLRAQFADGTTGALARNSITPEEQRNAEDAAAAYRALRYLPWPAAQALPPAEITQP